MSAPSEKAIERASRRSMFSEDVCRAIGESLHSPALGLERSVCLRDAISEAARAIAVDGDFDRWMREAHLDARHGTTNAETMVAALLARHFTEGA